MYIKHAILLVALVAGCWARPKIEDEQDVSVFYAESRIVGGTPAAQGAHPHMVGITMGTLIRSFVCGGSVIGSRTVLTAAHCLTNLFRFGSLVSSLRVTVGTNTWNQGGTSYTVARNVTHPNYVQATIKNDIALFITHNVIVSTATVRPISLSFNYVGGGVAATVAGWGRVRAGGAQSARLLQITVPTITGSQCVAARAQAVIDHRMRAPPVEPHIELCTQQPRNIGTCHGDSGSALAGVDNGQQIGVVSWGFPCALGAPDMYVRISAYQDWFQRHVV